MIWKEKWNSWTEDWSDHGASPDQQRITNFLKKREPFTNKKLFHVGIGDSSLALEVRSFSKIVGITVIENEIKKAKSLQIDDYEVSMCNKHTLFLLNFLPTEYDYIVDNGILTFTDCDICIFNLFHSYKLLLNVGGEILTDTLGMRFAKNYTVEKFKKIFDNFELPFQIIEYKETSPDYVIGIKKIQ